MRSYRTTGRFLRLSSIDRTPLTCRSSPAASHCAGDVDQMRCGGTRKLSEKSDAVTGT